MNEEEDFRQSIAGSNCIYKLYYMLLSQDIFSDKIQVNQRVIVPILGAPKTSVEVHEYRNLVEKRRKPLHLRSNAEDICV